MTKPKVAENFILWWFPSSKDSAPEHVTPHLELGYSVLAFRVKDPDEELVGLMQKLIEEYESK